MVQGVLEKAKREIPPPRAIIIPVSKTMGLSMLPASKVPAPPEKESPLCRHSRFWIEAVAVELETKMVVPPPPEIIVANKEPASTSLNEFDSWMERVRNAVGVFESKASPPKSKPAPPPRTDMLKTCITCEKKLSATTEFFERHGFVLTNTEFVEGRGFVAKSHYQDGFYPWCIPCGIAKYEKFHPQKKSGEKLAMRQKIKNILADIEFEIGEHSNLAGLLGVILLAGLIYCAICLSS